MDKESIEDTVLKINVCLKKWHSLGKYLGDQGVRSIVLTFFNKTYKSSINYASWRQRKEFSRLISNNLHIKYDVHKRYITGLELMDPAVTPIVLQFNGILVRLDYEKLHDRTLATNEVQSYPATELEQLSFERIRNFKFT